MLLSDDLFSFEIVSEVDAFVSNNVPYCKSSVLLSGSNSSMSGSGSPILDLSTITNKFSSIYNGSSIYLSIILICCSLHSKHPNILLSSYALLYFFSTYITMSL